MTTPSAALLPAPVLRPLLDANCALLRQGAALLAALDDARYLHPVPVAFGASLGAHFRHAIEHYTGLLRGLDAGTVDYEGRARDPRIEGERGYAGELFEQAAWELARVGAAGDRALSFRLENAGAGGAGTEAPCTPTTLSRELEYLLSHTVHHYALIAIMCRVLGYEPAADFGFAPSTLRFREAQAAAACAH